jgi:hypothetical protein
VPRTRAFSRIASGPPVQRLRPWRRHEQLAIEKDALTAWLLRVLLFAPADTNVLLGLELRYTPRPKLQAAHQELHHLLELSLFVAEAGKHRGRRSSSIPGGSGQRLGDLLQHINLFGEYDFSDDKLQDTVGIKPKKLAN